MCVSVPAADPNVAMCRMADNLEPYSAKPFSDTFYLIPELDFQLTIHLQCTLFCVFFTFS